MTELSPQARALLLIHETELAALLKRMEPDHLGRPICEYRLAELRKRLS